MPIRILIADDNSFVRDSLRYYLEGKEVEVVAEAATAQEAVSLALEEDLDLVLLDIHMPGGGLAALESIKSHEPTLPVLVHSLDDSHGLVIRSRQLGAAGYVIKGRKLSHLLGAIRAAAYGEGAWDLQPTQSVG